MFASISIKNFRCYADISIEQLERVNLIAGKNNVGKTALLEAIFLLANGSNITGVAAIANFRSIQKVKQPVGGELVFSPLFNNLNKESVIKINGWLKGEEHSVEIKSTNSNSTGNLLAYKSKERFELESHLLLGQILEVKYTNPTGQSYVGTLWVEEEKLHGKLVAKENPCTVYLLISNERQLSEEDAEKLGTLEIKKEPYELLESLRIVEPRLKRVATIVVAGTPIIHGDIGLNRMLPLSFMGDGLRRLTSILLTIANAPHGIVLIDEIENGLHHSVLSKIWQAIGDAARRFDTQVIATTHSYECIQAAHQAFSESDKYDFRLHRLDRVDDKVKAVTYDRETLEAAIDIGFEVR